jgi:hypothetical protein
MTRCGYCHRELVSVAHLLPHAKPACGNAACLTRAFRDAERVAADEHSSSKQAA